MSTVTTPPSVLQHRPRQGPLHRIFAASTAATPLPTRSLVGDGNPLRCPAVLSTAATHLQCCGNVSGGKPAAITHPRRQQRTLHRGLFHGDDPSVDPRLCPRQGPQRRSLRPSRALVPGGSASAILAASSPAVTPPPSLLPCPQRQPLCRPAGSITAAIPSPYSVDTPTAVTPPPSPAALSTAATPSMRCRGLLHSAAIPLPSLRHSP